MEIILAIVVVSTVIFFGALISLGNERQRKAIDGLRDQMSRWAVQDLKIKRGHLSLAVQVPDPLGWLNKAASRVCNYDLKLQVLQFLDEPQALICTTGDGGMNVLFSPRSPSDLQRIKSGKRNRLSQFVEQNPLLSLPKEVNIHELSLLNNSHLFDLELSIAWKALTGQDVGSVDSLWMYIVT